MKKLIFTLCLAAAAGGLYAQQAQQKDATSVQPQAAGQTLPSQQTQQEAAATEEKPALSQEEQYERFKARNKEIKKLAKAYRKAKTEEKKAEIKARLTQIVSEATDESIAWSKERIASVRTNLDQWEITLQEQEANLEQIKAQRVDDILSGEAERRHKLAQKRWKQEMKDRKKYMK